MYRVEIKSRAEREFRRLPREQRPRIREAMRALTTDPRPPGCKRLVGTKAAYRIRVGSYRIIYTVDDTPEFRVIVQRIADRATAYRHLGGSSLG